MLTHMLTLESASWFPWLLDMLLKSAVLLVLAGVTALLCWRASAAQRHQIWTLAVVGVLLLPVLSATLPAWHLLRWPQAVPTPQRMRTPASVTASPSISPAVSGEPTLPSLESLTTPATSTASAESPAVAPTGAQMTKPGGATIPTSITPSRSSVPWPVWIMLAWGIGTALVLAWTLYGYVLANHLRRRARTAPLAWGSEMPAGVRIRVSDAIAVPVVVGLLRPAILLPAQAEEWPEDRRRVVLLHELAHIQRGDILTHLLAQLACACYWTNPLVWVAAHRMRVERETACDDAILGTNIRASDYAAHLLAIANMPRGQRLVPAVGIAMARSSNLGKRVKTLLDARRNRRKVTARGVMVTALIVLPLLITIAVAQKPDENMPQSTLTKFEDAVALTPPDGAGLTITLDDRQTTAKTPDSVALKVHDAKLLILMNELWKAGATAININDQRIGPATAIRATQAVITVNQQPIAAPYTIRAIAPTAAVEAVNAKNGILYQLRAMNIQVTLTPEAALHLPALPDLPSLRFVQPVPPTREGWLAVWAGTVPLTGAGIVIDLSDTARALRLLDADLLQIVNELRFAGAEAITINEQRIGPRTVITMTGRQITIDGVPITARVRIKAIGAPGKLSQRMKAYTTPDGNSVVRSYTPMERAVTIPALVGSPWSITPEDPAYPKATITIKGDAYVDMPIWANIGFPPGFDLYRANLRYPFAYEPWFTWGYNFEVTRDGQPLPRRAPNTSTHGLIINGPGGGSAAPPSSPTGRLPLHLFYRFDSPGTYRIRFVLREDIPGVVSKNADGTLRENKTLLVSEWQELVVKPYTVAQRQAWQKQQVANPPKDVGLLVGDYLPSLLASPDSTVLPAFEKAATHRDPLVQGFAKKCLLYFTDSASRAVSPLLQQLIASPVPKDIPEPEKAPFF